MKLVQFDLPGTGRRVGLVRGDRVLDITAAEEGIGSTLDLLLQGRTPDGLQARVAWLEKRLRRKPLDWSRLQEGCSRQVPHLLAPLDPPEVWGIDGSYAGSPESTPEFFFKATPLRCLGPHAAIPPGDGEARVVPEAELAVVLGGEGAPLGLTAANDITARGLLRQDATGLAAAKVTRGCCALGPCLLTLDGIDLDGLQVRCVIRRGGEEIFAATTNTREVRGGILALLRRFLRLGLILPGTVLLTGTGIRVPEDQALAEGDRVDVEIQGIGRLSNPVRRPRRV